MPPIFVAGLLLGGLVTGAGCKLYPQSTEVPAKWQASAFHPPMPDHLFGDYKGIFGYIAACEGLPQDNRTILGLAADSTAERWHLDSIGVLLVIRADYYAHSPWGIRGAQGNGRYYAFQSVNNQWRLVGIFHGNSIGWEKAGDQLRVYTHWYMSASGSDPTVYTWKDGRFE